LGDKAICHRVLSVKPDRRIPLLITQDNLFFVRSKIANLFPTAFVLGSFGRLIGAMLPPLLERALGVGELDGQEHADTNYE